MNCDIRLPPNLTKNLLFYSKFCQFSTEVVGLLRKHNRRSMFMCICVDDYDVPSFVDCVPLIVTKDSRILKDNLVFDFVASLSPGASKMSTDSGAECQAASEFSNDISDRYSFVDDISQTNTNTNTNTKRFMSLDMLGANGEFPIICADLEGVSIEQHQMHQQTKRTLREETTASPQYDPVPGPLFHSDYSTQSVVLNPDKDNALEHIIMERETEIHKYQQQEVS